jgi:NAD(P)-dependent dehydrogenase (short-subunit alcohol dehydrogenase family)
VRVNAIAPGFIRTDMVAELLERDEEQILAGIPLHRIGEPEDVASAAVYLASEESSFLTGQVLNVNGGQWMG